VYLKRCRLLIFGVILFLLCILPVSVLASTSVWVSALLAGDITFQFDGQGEEMPAGYTVLLYENRTYVPARFVAEQLGASVGWDQANKIVRINTKPCAECQILQKEKQVLDKKVEEQDEEIKALEEKIKRLEGAAGEEKPDAEGQPSGNYLELPLAKVLPAFNIRVTGLFKDDNNTRVYLELENKKTVPLQLLQAKTTAIVDGEVYKTSDILHFTLDQIWYHNIDHEKIETGYVMLPPVPKDAKMMLLELTFLFNDAKQETMTEKFYIKLDS
jgi:hypothetical protein